jgi:endonuclease/exonuclease/phosphatase family metal-dependent hydrolase
MYGFWEKPHESTGSSWLYADASVHRLISDISVLIGSQSKHRIIASGDLNILHGYGEHGSEYWASRYATIFSRMKAFGLKFVGPQAPNGRGADPWPAELPSTSKNVPTFHSSHQNPITATHQLDYVFASESFANKVKVTALNQPNKWGPSDHCQILIEI